VSDDEVPGRAESAPMAAPSPNRIALRGAGADRSPPDPLEDERKATKARTPSCGAVHWVEQRKAGEPADEAEGRDGG